MLILLKNDNHINPIINILKNNNNTDFKNLFYYNDNKNLFEICLEYLYQNSNFNRKDNTILLYPTDIINFLKTNYKQMGGGYFPTAQVIDERNKCIFIMTKNNTLIPVSNNISLRTNIVYDPRLLSSIINMDNIKLISYKQMYSQIKTINNFTKNIIHLQKIKYLLYKKILDNKYNIFSFKSEYDVLIPIKIENETKNNIYKNISSNTELKFDNDIINEVNKAILSKNKVNNIHTISSKKFDYNNENYEIFRFNFSYFLEQNKKYKK